MILYQSGYSFRSINGSLSALVTFAFGGTFVWVSSECFKMNEGQLSHIVGGGFAIGSVFFLGASFYAMVSLLVGRRIRVQISTEGVMHGKRFVPWEEISDFFGTSYSNGVCLAYTPAKRKMHLEKSLPTTPLLSLDEYRALADRLHEQITPLQSHVRIELVPRQPVGD